MGALEWIVTTAVLSAVVGGAVSYWILDFEVKVLENRLNDIERELHRDRLDDTIATIEREVRS